MQRGAEQVPCAKSRILDDKRQSEAPYSEMDETQQRRLSIAREIVTWGEEMPALLARIAEALKTPGLPGRQKLEFEVWARRITASFKAIGEPPDNDGADATLYDQLIENTDRLRELIAAVNAALDAQMKRN
jgi:hypothetical protein